MQARRITDRVVVVTGAARGLGLAVVQRFWRDGCRVACLDRHARNLRSAVAQLRPKKNLLPLVTDVTNPRQVVDAFARIMAKWGRIDVLANIAGIAEESAFLNCPLKTWRRILEVNVTGMFLVAQAAARQMARQQNGGVIINMGSKNGLVAEVGYAAYNASKGAVVLLSKTMAAELAAKNIRVHCVCPGYIRTPLSDQLDGRKFQQIYARRLIPLNRLGRPEEIAGLFAFLAGPDAEFMTGETIVADGGHTCFDGRMFEDPAFAHVKPS